MNYDLLAQFLSLIFLIQLIGFIDRANSHLLSAAILRTTIELRPETIEYVGFPQSALNGTEVEIRLQCADDVDMTFSVQFVIRSSPCDKEFFDASRQSKLKNLLNFYFDHDYEIPSGYNYDKILFYKSKIQEFTCKDANGVMLMQETAPPPPFSIHNVHTYGADISKIVNVSTSAEARTQRGKREFAGLNGDSVDGGAKMSLSSWHPVQRLPMDGIYFLLIKFSVLKMNTKVADHGQQNVASSSTLHNVTVVVQWRGPYGYLSAIDYPLMRFFAIMCIFYIVLAFIWLTVCLKYWKDILRIQFWIGAVIVLGMIEKAMFYSEYVAMNNNGESAEGFIEVAELMSSLKRTMSRVLIIIVALGYGVVKPRLGSTLNQVVGVGFVYFVFSSVEGLARVSKNRVEAAARRQLTALPLIILEIAILWWIFTSLINTMRILRLRRNEVKWNVYRHFMNTLCFAALISGIFMAWTIYVHNMQSCLVDWKEYWVDTAFWHILFCSILVVIMILWRPSKNNQRYAFTPLLDDSEDENDDDEDELFSYTNVIGGNAATVLNQRNVSTAEISEKNKKRETDEGGKRIEEDLKWIEDNIPAAIADRFLMDEEEDRERIETERSKML